MPAFVPLRDPTPFTHPSHFHTVRWNFESPEEVGGVRYAHYDYEKHVVSLNSAGFFEGMNPADPVVPDYRATGGSYCSRFYPRCCGSCIRASRTLGIR